MHCQELTPELHSQYCNFIQNHPHASVEASIEWGILQEKLPSRKNFKILVVLEKEKILASALQIHCRLDYFSSFLWIPAGPLLPQDPVLAELCLNLLKEKWQEDKKALFVRLESLIPAEESPACLKNFGEASSSAYYPRHTLCLDLEKNLDTLWAEMAQKGRYHIRKAEKNALTVHTYSEAELPAYYALMKESSSRDHFSIHGENYYLEFLKTIPGAKLWMVSYENRFVAGAISVPFGKKFIYYFGASGNSDRKLYASYLLQWTMIQEAQKAGFLVYDFFGIADPQNPQDKLQSVTQFKTRFGGESIHYTPARQFILRPLFFAFRYRLLNILRKIRK